MKRPRCSGHPATVTAEDQKDRNGRSKQDRQYGEIESTAHFHDSFLIKLHGHGGQLQPPQSHTSHHPLQPSRPQGRMVVIQRASRRAGSDETPAFLVASTAIRDCGPTVGELAVGRGGMEA